MGRAKNREAWVPVGSLTHAVTNGQIALQNEATVICAALLPGVIMKLTTTVNVKVQGSVKTIVKHR